MNKYCVLYHPSVSPYINPRLTVRGFTARNLPGGERILVFGDHPIFLM